MVVLLRLHGRLMIQFLQATVWESVGHSADFRLQRPWPWCLSVDTKIRYLHPMQNIVPAPGGDEAEKTVAR